MRVALVFGAKGEVVKTKLCSIKDNLDIDCFASVPVLIDTALKRGTIYDRILVLANLLDEQTAKDLWSFWGMTSKSTSVVMLGKKGQDENKGRLFVDLFKVPNVSAMLVDNTTVQLVSEAVLLSNKDINERYGIKDFLKADTSDGVVVNVGKIEEPVVQPQVQEQPQEQQPVEEPTKSKRGLMSALFGSGKSQKKETKAEEKKPQKVNKRQSKQENTQPSQNKYDSQIQQNIEERQAEVPTNNDSFSQQQEEAIYQHIENSQSFGENSEINNDYASSQQQFNEESDFYNGSDKSYQNDVEPENNFTEPADYESEFSTPDQQVYETEDTWQEVEQTSDESFETEHVEESTHTEPEYIPPQSAFYNGKNDFDADEGDINETVAPLPMQSFDEPSKGRIMKDVAEVDEDLGGLGVASAESSYRKQNEQPKVVEKIVEKEIIRNVGGSDNLVKNILSGKNPTVIVVTGDRATGVTSTCLSLINFFSSKTSVLYVDFDTEFHGALSYLDYQEFLNNEPTKHNGIKLANNYNALQNCICSMESNLDILTSNYDCEVTDAEIKATVETICEVIPNYGIVIVDCPIKKLDLMSDLILTGTVLINCEASKRGFMNLLCALENCTLPLKYKKLIANKGSILLTKLHKDLDLKKLIKYVSSIYQPDGVDWMSMRTLPFSGKVDLKYASMLLSK